MSKLKAPIYQFALSALLGGVMTYYVFNKGFGSDAVAAISTIAKVTNTTAATTPGDKTPLCDGYDMKIRDGFTHVKPLLYSEQECESPKLIPLKEDINTLIESKKAAGLISSVSVYVRDLSKGDWTTYNEGETYHPASLNKVATLITYLRAAEQDPNLLNTKLLFDEHDNSISYSTYSSKTLQPGKEYTVKELLHYMIAYSDNESTILLLKHVKPEFHYKTYTDLGLSKPSSMVGSNKLTAKEFSVFMKVLYNATYLSPSSSEFASSLLTECDFKDGLLKGLPANITVAHKFGEFGDGSSYELHESGIVYNGNSPYIITVMTKGPDRTQLKEVISHISAMVYSRLSVNNTAQASTVGMKK